MSSLRNLNVPGDWYVDPDCCLRCGVPTSVAPDLFTWDSDDRPEFCYVKRQPSTADEIARMLDVANSQDLDCIRYSGDDKLVRAGLHNAVVDLPLPPRAPYGFPPRKSESPTVWTPSAPASNAALGLVLTCVVAGVVLVWWLS